MINSLNIPSMPDSLSRLPETLYGSFPLLRPPTAGGSVHPGNIASSRFRQDLSSAGLLEAECSLLRISTTIFISKSANHITRAYAVVADHAIVSHANSELVDHRTSAVEGDSPLLDYEI